MTCHDPTCRFWSGHVMDFFWENLKRLLHRQFKKQVATFVHIFFYCDLNHYEIYYITPPVQRANEQHKCTESKTIHREILRNSSFRTHRY